MNPKYYATIAALVLVTGACVSTPPAPTDQYYRLQPAPAPVTRLPAGTLHVGRFTADGLLRERALVYSDDRGHRRLKQHAYHFWADAPARLMQDYWISRMGATDRSPDGAGYRLQARIVRMERLLGGATPAIVLALELTLTDATGAAVHRRHEVSRPVPSAEVVDSVKAFESALDDIIATFAVDLAALTARAGQSTGNLDDPLARNQISR